MSNKKILFLFLFLLFSCQKQSISAPPKTVQNASNFQEADQFYVEQKVYQVVDNVYIAIGYGLANSILIVGDQGNIVIDTTENPETAQEIFREFQKISNQPILGIIYTHSHVDHWRGSPSFVNENTKIYAHQTFEKGFTDQNNLIRPILTQRGMKQFGFYLPPELQNGQGLGSSLQWSFDQSPVVYPTDFFVGEKSTITIAGITLEVQHAPGETDDQILIYYPDKKLLIAGDNYYMRFPNLYTIRGSSYRDTKKWYQSVDKMRAYQADYLLSCHGPYLSNNEEIDRRLTIYRDAIQYIHDYVIRGMNQGMTPDELVSNFIYPDFFDNQFDLEEKYGKVSWSIRNVYNGYLGFFDGKAVNLEPLSHFERSQNLIELLGGKEQLILQIDRAMEENNYQWAAELSDIGFSVFPQDPLIVNRYIHSLETLGSLEENPIARNYYFSEALELRNGKTFEDYLISPTDANSVPLRAFFESMPTRLNVEKAKGEFLRVGFNFPDTQEQYGVIIRNQIAEITNSFSEDYDVIVTVDSNVWKSILLKTKDGKQALRNGEMILNGNLLRFAKFSSLFE